jgi:large subunit ribosomal protein L17
MYKKVGTKKLGRKTAHRDSLIMNQLRTLFEYGKLNTTVQKAKATKARAESIISSVKTDDNGIVLRRTLQETFGNTILVKKVMEYGKKEGSGITMVKVGFRAGDNATMARLDLMGYKGKKKVSKKGEKEEIVEKKESKSVEKGNIEQLGRKSITKDVKRATKQRAHSRSGL